MSYRLRIVKLTAVLVLACNFVGLFLLGISVFSEDDRDVVSAPDLPDVFSVIVKPFE